VKGRGGSRGEKVLIGGDMATSRLNVFGPTKRALAKEGKGGG